MYSQEQLSILENLRISGTETLTSKKGAQDRVRHKTAYIGSQWLLFLIQLLLIPNTLLP